MPKKKKKKSKVKKKSKAKKTIKKSKKKESSMARKVISLLVAAMVAAVVFIDDLPIPDEFKNPVKEILGMQVSVKKKVERKPSSRKKKVKPKSLKGELVIINYDKKYIANFKNC